MNKDITLYIAQFLYRIRYKIFFGSLIVTLLVAYFSKFIPHKYTVQTSIYTGIVSATGVADEKLGFFEINNMFENIINLTKAKGTLESVSIRLFATNMVNGNLNEDNLYIKADQYKELLDIVPLDVKDMIDPTSLEKSIGNLERYKKEIPGNFLFTLFNYNHPHYSYKALREVQVKRVGNSDIIDISYTADDPGIALSTVKLLTEELTNAYEGFKYKASNDVVSYYEEQLSIVKRKLNILENDLTNYNVENGVINYLEQTKAIAISFTEYENKVSLAKQEYESSSKILNELDRQMGIRANLMRSNADFVSMLDTLSTHNAKIAEIEMFSTNEAIEKNDELKRFKNELTGTEKRISRISDDMNKYKISKEGVAIEDMVNQWLKELVRNVKAKAELKVLNDRKAQYAEQYRAYSPVGAEINKREREIRVTEESYLEILHALNLAKLKQKNIQLSTATLNVVSQPVYPLSDDGSKRMLLIIAAFIGSVFFIVFIHLIIELLDRTLRDPNRTMRLTSTPVLSIFTGSDELKYRGYSKACYRICSDYLTNRIKTLIKDETPLVVNFFSVDPKEGKSFVIDYLMTSFREQNIDVETVRYGVDFTEDLNYSTSDNLNSVLSKPIKKETRVIFVEHNNLKGSTIPSKLVLNSDLNLVIMNAKRVWTESDQIYLNLLKSESLKDKTFICLNNTSRDIAETFVGQLPPIGRFRSLSYVFLNMGITSTTPSIENRLK